MVNSAEYHWHLGLEPLGRYGEGGQYYVININDTFQGSGNRNYHIINKLGCGAWSTVWIAKDDDGKAVSIKVGKVDESVSRELAVLQRIQEDPTKHPGRKHLPQLIDHFYKEKCGQKYLFLVMGLYGPKIGDVIWRLVDTDLPRLSHSTTTKLSRQLFLGLECLDSYGIVHGDIHVGNILVDLPEDLKEDDDVLESVEQFEVTRHDKAPLEKEVPKYLIDAPKFEYEMEDDEVQNPGNIILVDFGSAFFSSDPPKTINVPPHMSPPELVFGQPLTKGVDVWALACTVYHITLGRTLIGGGFHKKDNIPEFHYFIGGSTRWLLESLVDSMTKGKYIWKDIKFFQYVDKDDTLESYFEEKYDRDSKEMSDTEKDAFGNNLEALRKFLRKSLILDPSCRPSLGELQDEEYIRKGEATGEGEGKEEAIN